MEHILATTNESTLGDKVSIFSKHFQDVDILASCVSDGVSKSRPELP